MKKFIIAYYFFLVFLLSFFVTGYVDSQDGFQYLAVARNIYYTGEPTAPPYEFTGGVGVGKNIHMSTHVGKDGKTYSATGLGFSLALVPAVAITDVVYKIYNLTPPLHFPLESDWLIHLTATFTNIFFAAGLGITIYLYLREMGVKHKSALIISLIGLLTTNLFVASKHLYAHTMFTFFLFSSFLLLKIHSRKGKNIFLLLSGLSWGVALLTYNISYVLTAIPYFLYFLIINVKNLKRIVWIVLGILPFYLLNSWYTNLISIPAGELATKIFSNAISTPAGVIYEGLYGQLLSPGRSFFIYSPILLLPFIFWFKIKKGIVPEVLSFLLVLGLYVIALSLTWSPHPGGFAEPLWHGEYSWGPRYLIPSIPFGLVIVGYIYEKVKTVQKLIFFVPLILVGFYVELLGISMHYQIKFQSLESYFEVNGIQFTPPIYSNLLPRFSPLVLMSKNFITLVKTFPKIIDHGPFNVRFTDGIDFAFNVGPERWRAIDKAGYILFDNRQGSAINTMAFDLINHPIGDTREVSKVNFYINGERAIDTQTLKIGERKKILIKLDGKILKESNNLLIIQAEQKDYESYFNKKQFTAIINFYINDILVNKETIDVPFQSWGGESNPWMSWHVHTQVAERTPYLWWLYPVYYWDVPKKPFGLLFAANFLGLIYFTKKVISPFGSSKNRRQPS